MAIKKFRNTKPTHHHSKKPFDPNRYGKLWSGIEFKLTDQPAYVEKGTQPIIGTLNIGGMKFPITWTESNRVIEQLYDGQHRYNVAKRIGMLEKGAGTPVVESFTTYDGDGNVVATNQN